MILGVGVDLLEVRRVAACMDAGLSAFFRRAYSLAEQREASGRADKAHYYASRFAGKEAVLKCLGPVPERLRWNEIEILSGESGAPFVRLGGQCLVLARSRGIQRIHLSLSSDAGCEIAFAVAEGEAI